MKLFILSLLALASVQFAAAQTTTVDIVTYPNGVPELVRTSFTTNLPGITATRWEKHSGTNKKGQSFEAYVCIYTDKGIRTRARFRADGTFVHVVRTFGPKEAPMNIAQPVLDKHPGSTLRWVREFDKKKKGTIVYKVRVAKGTTIITEHVKEGGTVMAPADVPADVLEDTGEGE